MKQRKFLRSRCKYERCRTQFRHANPAAEYCKAACRTAVYRINRKKKEEDERSEKYAQMSQTFLKERAQEVQRLGAETERSATARHVEEGSPPSEPARRKYHLVDADGLGRCGVHQVGEDHATSVEEFRVLERLSVDICKGCVGAVNRALDRHARRVGGLGDPPPKAGVITITMPDRAPMTPLGRRY